MMIAIGAASIDITHGVGAPIQGATVNQVARTIRDRCEANALMVGEDDAAVLLVSCDLIGLTTATATRMRQAMADAAGVAFDSIILAATHMHSGPSLLVTHPLKTIDQAYLDLLEDRLATLAAKIVASRQPGRLGWGLGSAQISYNRRCCWANGTHTMHGDSRRDDFTGLEGPDDSAHLALFAVDAQGAPIAVLYNNGSHPTSFYGRDFYSADFPGLARDYLRQTLGGDLAVLYLNGAFGDLESKNLLIHDGREETGEQTMARLAHLVTGETLRLFHETSFVDVPPIAHVTETMSTEVHLPAADRLEWAVATLDRLRAGEEVSDWDRTFAFGIHQLHEQFHANPVDSLELHAIRIGDVGLLTQPGELFCQFGLDIKRRSPALITGVVGQANGTGGYIPTMSGHIGGGYSAEPIHWTRFTPDTGYRLVDRGAKLLHQLWP